MQISYELEPLEELDEQEQFLSILYHDSQGGNAIRMLLGEENSEKPYVRHFANKDYKKVGYRSTNYNAYVSVNTFKSYKRGADDVFNFSGIYIDLDGHDYASVGQLDGAIERTKKKLRSLYEKGQITAPTMITYTGRGLGLFYILSRSIANIPKNKRSIKMLDDVKTALMSKYRKLLNGKGLLQVDATVKDNARVCRLPLTLNKKCNRWCRLIHVSRNEEDEVVFHSLKQLAEENHLFDEINEARKKLKSSKIVSLDAYKKPFLTIRLQKLELLQELRVYDCHGCREYMTFIFYNAAKQIYGEDIAEVRTNKFNEKFIEPLCQEELSHIRDVVNRNVSPTGDYEGFYKLPDSWIIETLEVTEEENRECRFGASKRQIEREQLKKEHANVREARNTRILEYIKENGEQTYKEIAAFFGVSESTVRRIAKTNNIKRYKVVEKTAEESRLDGTVENVQNLAQSLLGVPFAGGSGVPGCDSIALAYSCLYAEVRDVLKRLRQVPGQLSFRLGKDGILEYYDECS